MGAGLDQWLHDSGDLPGKFWEVIDCTSHTSFVSIQIKEPTDTGAESDDSFVISFSNCSFEGENGFEELMAEYNTFTEMVEKLGILRGSSRLLPTSAATTVRVRDGKTLTTDGPFAETKEQFGGYYILDCKDLDQAIEFAAQIPTARDGSIEVRPQMG